MSIGGGKGKSSSKSRVQIPDFLKPFLNQATGTAGSALSNLQQQAGGDLVADFNPIQQLAQGMGVQEALSGQAFPTAQNTAMQIAQGGQLPGTDILSQLASGSAVPQQTTDLLTQLSQGGAVPQTATDALEATAGGDFLFGGQGFDQAVEAAVRAARPAILSTFGAAGPSRATGGLAETAIAQSAQDAFARQFANERRNQLGAAGQLGQLGLAQTGQQADIAQALGQLGLAGTGLQGDLATSLGQLGLGGQSQQLQAAGMLPDLATADINLLSGVGEQIQGQEQAELETPFNAQLQLLQAALGGLPISSLLGRDTKGKQRGLTFGFDLGGGD